MEPTASARPAAVRVAARAAPPARPVRARRRLRAAVHRRAPLRPGGRARRGDKLEDYFAARLGRRAALGRADAGALLELAAGRKAPLKSFLLTQSRVAGIGNIYADEALWRARLHPLSPAGSMKLEHAERLVEGIVGALEAGLDHGGASIDDYRDARGERGSMQEEFLVHTREGEPCLRCDEPSSSGSSSAAARPTSARPARSGCGGDRGEGATAARGARHERAAAAAGGLRGRPLVRPGGRDRLHRRAPPTGDARRRLSPRRRPGHARDRHPAAAGRAEEASAVLLTGGSAFGLAAADGVVRWLEEHGRGYATPAGRVPLVPAAVIYDLPRAIRPPARRRGRATRPARRPSRACRSGARSGSAPARRSRSCSAASGRTPAGSATRRLDTGTGDTVAAMAAVNAVGDVIDEDGSVLAGPRGEDGEMLRGAELIAAMEAAAGAPGPRGEHDAGLRLHRRGARQARLLAWSPAPPPPASARAVTRPSPGRRRRRLLPRLRSREPDQFAPFQIGAAAAQ